MRQQGRQTTIQQQPLQQQPLQQQHNGFGQNTYQHQSYPMFGGTCSQLSSIAQQKQPEQEDIFDEEAFERAFEAAKSEMEQAQEQERQRNAQHSSNGGHTLMDYQTQLERLEQQQEGEEKQQADVELGNDVLINESAEHLMRSDYLVAQERIGSDRILSKDQDQRAEKAPHDESDDLARTAGQLLDNVKHDQSQKFQESNFLALMRQLRDREVRVEGDKMVDVSTFSWPTSLKHYHPGPAEMITCRVLGCERVDG